ncbi:hypothetical protein LEP1GSC125_2484 [Leptospira mayottensis 200901122]|uniref:Uncharacterized protein n=1 Tax=Leptospira mayottensis 200901122 TaxID=1193010 RepID=A0AA87MSK7_9LEPT|nr:hypothetical protein LEP1GSC125_2484 [Leptospira mayottensis 200901122]
MTFLIVFQKSIYFETSLNDIMNSLKHLRSRFRTDSLLTM